ncbi:MAG TPA: hypothetical protein VFB80_04010 [Pirellulaceae bacterium]|nr:hypothetical protein [Pirellulaceae bacterium]
MRTLAILFAVLLCSCVQATEPEKLTAENFKKIKLGASYEFVYTLIGEESVSEYEYGTTRCLVWRVKEQDHTQKYIRLMFERDKVTGKWQVGL